MANAGCINAIGFDGCFLRTLQCLDSSNIGVGVQYTAPNPLDDKRFDYITYTDKCGCQCCLTDENEILIYATQGVIKNLTLTNDDTNEKVIVKWTDLFGSNRAKTVVRYKTGSYPSSPTDGTLAVEETTQNQYQTNGYGVSGLTDGTTYYFSVFALDGDGTTINVQSTAITTDFEWKPSSHTYAYFPMVNNTTDQLGHLSFSGGTQKTIGGHTGYEWSINQNIAYNGYNSRMQFIVVRIYQYGGSTSSYYRQLLCLWNSMLYNELRRDGEYGNAVQIQTQNSSSGSWSGGQKMNTGITANQWYLLAYGYDGSNGYVSVNGGDYQLIGGPSSSAGYSGYSYFMYGNNSYSTGAKMVLGATIYEDQMWNIADLKKYWNKYKSQYGY